MAETYEGIPNLPIHWMFTDPINRRYDDPVSGGYAVDRWRQPQALTPFCERMHTAALRALGLLDADGQVVTRRPANA